MTSTVTGKNVAILIANGFDETQMTEIQRALTKAKANVKTIAPEHGVVNGWQGAGWGHYFPVDAQINEALGSDFDMLVLPGGERGIAKLKANLHTRRIVGHFLEAEKPVAAIGAGIGLLALSNKIAQRNLAAPDALHEELAAAGASLSEDEMTIDGFLLTATGEDIAAWVEASLSFFSEVDAVQEAA